jgi:hypothetical protein
MTQTFAEILILVVSTLFAGLIFFVTFVLTPVLNDLDEATFGHFVTLFYRHATTNVYEIVASSITIVAGIPYLFFYHFNHWWFIAGLLVFLASSCVGKILKLPMYKRVAELDAQGGTDKAALAFERRRWNTGNLLYSLFCVAFVALMVVQLGIGK